ncbi:MAG: glycosyltransferase family 4 protein [Opitutales bacterium]
MKAEPRNPACLMIGNYPPDRQWSMLQLADTLMTAFDDLGGDVHLFQPRETWTHRGQPHRGFGKWIGYANKFLHAPRTAGRTLADLSRPRILHVFDQGNSPFLRIADSDTPKIVTVHDLMAIRSALGKETRNPTRWTGRCLQAWIARNLGRADWFACVSGQTRQDLEWLLPGSRERSSVIPVFPPQPYQRLEADTARDRLKRLAPGCPEPPFVLNIGKRSWYKNRCRLIEAYGRLLGQWPDTPPLVLFGDPLTDSDRRRIQGFGTDRQIVDLGNGPPELIEALLSLAACLVFPSLYEGFGLPPLEAQACGCPVVAGRAGSLPEVLADSVEWVDPEDSGSIAAGLHRVLADSEHRTDLVARGRTNRERFSAEHTARAYLDLYRSLADS